MVTLNRSKWLSRHLFADANAQVYAILDGAAIPELPVQLQVHGVDAVCLYRGDLIPELTKVAPYQVRLNRESPFTQWLLEAAWGQHWGIFALSSVDWRSVREHYCALNIVYDPEGQPLYFRYYDPRVLRVYLPTCNVDELGMLFGPVSRLVCEDEDGSLLKYWLANGQLGSERVALEAAESL